MSRYTGNFETRLSCDHVFTTTYKAPGEEFYCRRCQSLVHVTTSLKKYVWRCHTCGRRRFYIARRLYGETQAMKHKRETGHHVTYQDMDGKVLWDSHPTQNVQEILF